ncbi:MAG: DUF6572 domain-containing protein [Myxococcota bacterium]
MRLGQTDTVDFLGIEKETGVVLVTLVDDCDWADELQHLKLLQAKVNRYLDFIESGEVYDQLLQSTGVRVPTDRLVRINVLAKFPPPEEGHRFFEQVRGVAEQLGVRLNLKVVSSET